LHQHIPTLDIGAAMFPQVNASLTLVRSLQLPAQPITTMCLVKPDGVAHVAKIIDRLQQVSFFIYCSIIGTPYFVVFI
jgi:hypothetical protein